MKKALTTHAFTLSLTTALLILSALFLDLKNQNDNLMEDLKSVKEEKELILTAIHQDSVILPILPDRKSINVPGFIGVLSWRKDNTFLPNSTPHLIPNRNNHVFDIPEGATGYQLRGRLHKSGH